MTSLRSRRQDPVQYARGWELAVVALFACVAVLGAVLVAAVGVASRLFGDGWVWPRSPASAPAALAGILSGHPGPGLPLNAAPRLAGATVIYVVATAFEAAAVAVLVC